jgi:hypothetical protein
VAWLRAEIETRTEDLPDGSRVLVRGVPQLTVPPYYFGWELLSALGRPFTATDLSGRVVVFDPRNRSLNDVTDPAPAEFARTVDIDYLVPRWIASRHRQRQFRDYGR